MLKHALKITGFWIFLCCQFPALQAQVSPKDTFQAFIYQEGDTTYVMKQYAAVGSKLF